MEATKSYSFSTFIPDVVAKFSDRKALGFVDEEYITYSQMGKQIEAARAFLEALELSPGDRVVIYSQNMPNWGIVYFALQCMGIVTVPVLPDFNSHELDNVLEHCEAKAIFVSEGLEYKLKETKKSFIKDIIRLEDFSVLSGKDNSPIYNPEASYTSDYLAPEDELAILLYTSGTTGNSKGVMLSQKNILFNTYQCSLVQPIKEDDRFLSVLPLSHTFENTLGLILPIMHGAKVSYLRKPPTASVLMPALKSVQPTIMLTVPMIIEKVYRNSILPQIKKKAFTRILYKTRAGKKFVHKIAGKKLYQSFGGKLHFYGIGGAKLDAQVEQFLRDAKFPYAIGYGLTETSPMLAGSTPAMTKFQAIGPKVVDMELILHDPDAKTGEGEIWAKGPNIMLGYYKNEEKTREVLTPDGWFKTGDLGIFDKNGCLTHKGRLKNIIVGSNGENIYPEEIESLINNFRHVLESIVMEKKGKLVALVHFNREELETRFLEMKAELSNKVDEKLEEVSQKVDVLIEELTAELQQYVNNRVSKSSKLQLVIAHADPFQKTATLKIKRYLYGD